MGQSTKVLQVLLVEDNPGDSRLVAELVADSGPGLILDTVSSLREALEWLDASCADVVLLDLNLPDSDGLDTFSRIQDAAPGVAVIALTGNSDAELATNAVERGAQDFLVKGRVDGDLLARAINYAVGRKRSERSLRDSEERYRELYERTPLAYQSVGPDGRMLIVNQAWLDTFGYQREEVVGRPFSQFVAPEYLEGIEPAFHVLESEGASHGELEMMHHDGSRRFVSIDGQASRDADGVFRQTHDILTDITQQKLAEEAARAVVAQLEELAMLDPLTKLLNRRGFDFRAEQVALDALRNRQTLTLLYGDVDNMKEINDEYGHAQGDQALTDVGTVLRETFRSVDVVARMGGDEFAVLTTGMDEEAQDVLCRRIDSAVQTRVEAEGRPYSLAMSCGMAVSAVADVARIEQLLRTADERMYQRKAQRRRERDGRPQEGDEASG